MAAPAVGWWSDSPEQKGEYENRDKNRQKTVDSPPFSILNATNHQIGMSAFYNIDSTRVSQLEYLWWHKSPLVLISWLMKWLHQPISCSSDDPNTESTLPFVTAALPAEIASRFEPLANELAALGFFDPVYHAIEDSGTRATIYWATFRHESGEHLARIHNRVWQQAQNPNRALFPMFFTAFTDGTFLVSSSGKPDMAAPKTVQMNRMFRASAARLWEKHQRLLVKTSERKLLAPVRSREDLIEFTERHHVLVRDFHLARGVFRPRTAAEQAQADSFAASVAQAKAEGLENAEVLAELQKLQGQKAGWAATFPILVISLLLFVVVGAARWNWQYTLLILLVLLFHESGHWLAMRIFHYRNLRMFFIPLFGAAVVGRNWNVPGWQKALVSLAGPLPGIALGIFLGAASLRWNLPWLTTAALVFVFVNGFNLLPVLPLDGGHVLHTILFCRNRWLNVIFRLLAIGALLWLGAAGFSRLFFYLAFFMGVSLPVAFKLASITDQLRKTPLPEPQPGEDQIPVPTAQAIIAEVKAAFPKNAGNKQIAQHTLNIFETLNARPPGALGTLGLMAVHGGAILLVAAFGLVFTIGKHSRLGDFVQAALRQPQHSFKPGGTQQWQGAGFASGSASPHSLLVATFKQHQQATAEFSFLTPDLPANSRLTLFGDSLLLSLPASDDTAREKWFDRLQTATTNLFVSLSNQPVALNLYCVAPTARVATNLSGELEDYFNSGPGLQLMAPWSPEYASPVFADKHYARQFWHRLDLEVAKTARDPALKDYFNKMMAAEHRGATSEVKRLQAEVQRVREQLATQAREQLRATATNAAYPALIDLHAALAKVAFTNRAARAAILRQVAASLGDVKYFGGKPDDQANALGAVSGAALRHGLIIELSYVQMNDATVGLPSLAGWLCDQKCAGIKYDLFSGFGAAEEDEQ